MSESYIKPSREEEIDQIVARTVAAFDGQDAELFLDLIGQATFTGHVRISDDLRKRRTMELRRDRLATAVSKRRKRRLAGTRSRNRRDAEADRRKADQTKQATQSGKAQSLSERVQIYGDAAYYFERDMYFLRANARELQDAIQEVTRRLDTA